MIGKSQWLRLRVTGFFVFIGHVLYNTWKEVKKHLDVEVWYIREFILIFKNTGLTQVVSHKKQISRSYSVSLRTDLKKTKIESEKDDAILSYNQAFDLLPTFSSEKKANKNKA